jgi:NAD(P)-dependent dehydrogenase (short-subunit alcohol dehydrogenase family)
MVVKNHNVMGVAKAGLEAAVRYIAAELGPKGIRVHAISPGPLVTRAASGIPEFDEVMDKAQATAPTRSLVSIDDVGAATAFLALARRREAHHGRRHVYRRRVSHHRLRHEAHKRSHIVWPILRRGKAIHLLRRHPYVASISRRRNRQRL